MSKILQIFPKLQRGGLEIGALQIATALKARSQGSLIIAEPGPLLKTIEERGLDYIPLSTSTKNPLKILWNAYRLIKIIKAHNVALVHLRSRAPAWSAYLACKWTKTPTISTLHGMYKTNGSLKNWYNSVMVRPTHIITISHEGKKYIQTHYTKYLTPHTQIHVIYRGIEERFFSITHQKTAKQELYDKLDIPEKSLTILICGRVGSQKGHHILLEAIPYLQDLPLHIICVGDTTEHADFVAKMNQRLKDIGWTHKVHKVGAVDDTLAYYDAVDLVVFPITRPEPFGRVIVEAQARKKCVIASDLGASREVLSPHLHEFLVPPNDSYALAKAIRKHFEIPKKAMKDLCEKAYSYVEKNFREDHMVNSTIQIYEKILKETATTSHQRKISK